MGSCEVTLILLQVTVSVTFISYFILSSMFHLLTQPSLIIVYFFFNQHETMPHYFFVPWSENLWIASLGSDCY